jgi:hypothetical protein
LQQQKATNRKSAEDAALEAQRDKEATQAAIENALAALPS